MLYEEFVKAIGECVKDPDNLSKFADTLTEAYKEQSSTAEAYKAKITELEQKNNDLRDSNVELTLKVLSQVNQVEEAPEKTREQRVAELTKKFLND